MLVGGERRRAGEQRRRAARAGERPDPGQHDGDEQGDEQEQGEQAEPSARGGLGGAGEQLADLAEHATDDACDERRLRLDVLAAAQLLLGRLAGGLAVDDEREQRAGRHVRDAAAADSETSRPSARIRRST